MQLVSGNLPIIFLEGSALVQFLLM